MVFKDMRIRRLGVNILAVDGAFEDLGIDVSIVVVEVLPW